MRGKTDLKVSRDFIKTSFTSVDCVVANFPGIFAPFINLPLLSKPLIKGCTEIPSFAVIRL